VTDSVDIDGLANIVIEGQARYDPNFSYLFRHLSGPKPLSLTRRERVIHGLLDAVSWPLFRLVAKLEALTDAVEEHRPPRRYPPPVEGEPFTYTWPSGAETYLNQFTIDVPSGKPWFERPEDAA
jgi:hypothetical protein